MKKWILLAAAIVLAILLFVLNQSCAADAEKPSEATARNFVRNCPTFTFDGMEDTLMLVSTEKLSDASWKFTYQFQSRHAGYGDRTGEVLAQVITPHEAVITLENGEVKSAVMDGRWDMITQKML
jgi:hypothetical protein